MPEEFASQADPGTLLAAFQAGSVGPDLGYFPGGPRYLSLRLHHEAPADFLRCLLGLARCQAERAFAAGWALHLYTDIAIHPLVNAYITERGAGRPDLRHKRLETGMDCRLLEREEMLPEWRPRLWSPLRSDGSSLISEAVGDFYEQTDSAADIRRGWESLDRWIGRLPWILLWTGSTCPPRFRYWAGVVGAAVNPVSRFVLGRLLQPIAALEDTVSIASPWSPEPLFTERVLRAAEEVLERFGPNWEQQVAQMKNTDLDTGEPAGPRGVPR